MKHVIHNVADCLVRGRAWYSYHFKTWGACWPQGLNRLQLAVWWLLAHCWEKRLHALPQAWLLKISEHLMAGFMVSRVTLLCTKLYLGNLRSRDPSTVEGWRKEQLLKIIESYELQNICNADESGLYCMLPHNLQWWQEFQGEDDSSVSLQCQWDWRTPTISYWEESRVSLL